MFRKVFSLSYKKEHVRGIVWIAFIGLFGLSGIVAGESRESQTGKHVNLRIAIHCGKKVLQVWHHAELIREYPIEVGKGGLAKRRNGDHRTPIGNYEISWMASRKSDVGHTILDGKSWCKGNAFVYADKGPALEKLWSDAYGGSEATVISINYPNDEDARKGYTGECIHIHAVKRPHDGMLRKSYGCIHMFAPDAMELYEIVRVGTPVKILP